jgi:hypothetical protein
MCSLEVYGNIPEHQNLNCVFVDSPEGVSVLCRPKVKRA